MAAVSVYKSLALPSSGHRDVLSVARHSCATLMHLRGVPVAVIAAWLGHASAAFTMAVYAHSQDDALKAAATSFGRVVTICDTEAHHPDIDRCERVCQRKPGAPTGTRTQTGRILSPLPLPIGLWGLGGNVARRRRRRVAGTPRQGVPWPGQRTLRSTQLASETVARSARGVNAQGFRLTSLKIR